MALTKPTAQAAVAPTTGPATEAAAAVKPVAFESMDETAGTAAPAANESTVVEPIELAATAATAAATSTAVAAPAASTLAVRQEASAFAKEVEAMKGGANFDFGNFETFKGIQGVIQGTGDNKAKLGRWVKVSMVAWDDRNQISPGSDVASAKDYVAYSKDGKTIDSVIGKDKLGGWVGRSVQDYLQHLRDSDWKDASMSRYIDVACVVHDGESKAAKELAGEVICISLSKSSIPSFSAYQEKLNMKAKAVARGIPGVTVPADPFTFFFQTEAAERGDNKWTKLKVSDKLKLED